MLADAAGLVQSMTPDVTLVPASYCEPGFMQDATSQVGGPYIRNVVTRGHEVRGQED